jgi:hypothetical protein
MTDPDRLPEDADEWDARKALQNLRMESALDAHGTPQTTARRLFEEALPVATMAITHLAQYSMTEVIRFNAAKYIVERTMGPAERMASVDGVHAWDAIYDNVLEEAQGYLNKE